MWWRSKEREDPETCRNNDCAVMYVRYGLRHGSLRINNGKEGLLAELAPKQDAVCIYNYKLPANALEFSCTPCCTRQGCANLPVRQVLKLKLKLQDMSNPVHAAYSLLCFNVQIKSTIQMVRHPQ